ncbi:hypothetical protein PRUPE_6G027900 [Prunus persica]|uniref:Mediator complex subunit 15 KIX domain-containing protein n=1 Tax=Prunus persica TaxID=3760 RepID=A0A251NM36_PRUPE|nr:hypothetical protein PRUPE_6G027900 [Prunus persica]
MDTDNEKPRPPQGGSSEPSMDTDKMYADDNESPSEDEDGEPSMSPSEDEDGEPSMSPSEDEDGEPSMSPSGFGLPLMSPSGDGDPSMGTGDWRNQLQPDTRQKIVNKIMETLKRHLPFSSQEGLQELKKIAVRFEEKIYAAATSQSDYLRKISLKMLTMEIKSQNTMANSLQSYSDESFLTELVPIFLDQSSEGNIDRKKESSEGSLLTELVPTFLDQSSEDNIDLKKRSSEDSISPTRHANGVDWQEEVYQEIEVMKEMYLPELSEMYQRFASYLLQHNSLPQPPKSKQLDKLNFFKAMLERLISVLQISKSSISPGLKDKLVLYEKQIVNFININGRRKPVSSLHQGQLPPSRMHSMQLSQSHITRVQSHENQINPQMLLMNLQGSAATLQQNNMARLQQSSMSSLSGTAQQNMMYWLQPSSNMFWLHPSYNLDSGQGNTLNSLQQFALGSAPQTPVSASQQANVNALSSQSGVSILQLF